jgi:hypothetical protein
MPRRVIERNLVLGGLILARCEVARLQRTHRLLRTASGGQAGEDRTHDEHFLHASIVE